MRKVWNAADAAVPPARSRNPTRASSASRGGSAADWRYDAYYQYGSTKSTSLTHNAGTNLRLAFATGRGDR